MRSWGRVGQTPVVRVRGLAFFPPVVFCVIACFAVAGVIGTEPGAVGSADKVPAEQQA